MIFLQALNIILNGITFAFGWFLELYDAAGALGIWFTVVIVFMLYRFILAPLFGQVAGSDVAARTAKGYRTIVNSVRSRR